MKKALLLNILLLSVSILLLLNGMRQRCENPTSAKSQQLESPARRRHAARKGCSP